MRPGPRPRRTRRAGRLSRPAPRTGRGGGHPQAARGLGHRPLPAGDRVRRRGDPRHRRDVPGLRTPGRRDRTAGVGAGGGGPQRCGRGRPAGAVPRDPHRTDRERGRPQEHRRLPVRLRLRPRAAGRRRGDRRGRGMAGRMRAHRNRTGHRPGAAALRAVVRCRPGLPIQLHAGYGDPDVELHRCDPLLLTRFIRSVQPHGVDLLLLHCYPFHRNAGYLAQVFPHVFFDVGLGVNYTGVRSDAVVAESLELAPFAKILFSSDAWGPPELHHLGALLWRRGMLRAMAPWVGSGEWDLDEAVRVARMIGHDNARRVYGLEGGA
ncbi:amidohydrolase family protein [Streptomyces lydicamycinicus]|nr:amidohydrolase family protein [Streptomyces lydicamycinicus]USA00649.1 amidohydrolase family protein [Streptomyces lydicamycinicus]